MLSSEVYKRRFLKFALYFFTVFFCYVAGAPAIITEAEVFGNDDTFTVFKVIERFSKEFSAAARGKTYGTVQWWYRRSHPPCLLCRPRRRIGGNLKDGEHPVVHSDRGCHYRWPGWIQRMDDNNLIRSMSRKGCSPDNSACEGFFGRLKNEIFYKRERKDVTLDEFINIVNNYIKWYNETRIKKSLGYKSPIEYRKELGLL